MLSHESTPICVFTQNFGHCGPGGVTPMTETLHHRYSFSGRAPAINLHRYQYRLYHLTESNDLYNSIVSPPPMSI